MLLTKTLKAGAARALAGAFLAAALAFTAAPASAEADFLIPLNGQDLKDLIDACNERDHPDPASDMVEAGRSFRDCYGFQSGLAAGWLFYTKFLREQAPEEVRHQINAPFCLAEVKDHEVNQAILDFLAAHKSALNLPAPWVVMSALVISFPCQP